MVNENIDKSLQAKFNDAIGYHLTPDSLAQLQGWETFAPLDKNKRSEFLRKAYLGRKPLVFRELARTYSNYLQKNKVIEPLVTGDYAYELIIGTGQLAHGALVLYLSPDLGSLLDCPPPQERRTVFTLRQALETEFLKESRPVNRRFDANRFLLQPLLRQRLIMEAIKGSKKPAPLYWEAAEQVQTLVAVVEFKKSFKVNRSLDEKIAKSSPSNLSFYNDVILRHTSFSLLPFEDFFRQEAQRFTQEALVQVLQSIITAPAKRAAFMNLIYNPVPHLFKPTEPAAVRAGLRDYVVLHLLLRQGLQSALGSDAFIATHLQRLAELFVMRRQIEQDLCYEKSWKNSLPREPFAHYELAYMMWSSLQALSAVRDEQLQALIVGLNDPSKEASSVITSLKLDALVNAQVERVYASLSAHHPLKYYSTPAAQPEVAAVTGLEVLFSQLSAWLSAPLPVLSPWEQANAVYQIPTTLTLAAEQTLTVLPPPATSPVLQSANL